MHLEQLLALPPPRERLFLLQRAEPGVYLTLGKRQSHVTGAFIVDNELELQISVDG